jgi:hypothetical protein
LTQKIIQGADDLQFDYDCTFDAAAAAGAAFCSRKGQIPALDDHTLKDSLNLNEI